MNTESTSSNLPRFRMSTEEYRKLEKSLPPPAISREDDAVQAAYRLGIQLVLSKLREQFVV